MFYHFYVFGWLKTLFEQFLICYLCLNHSTDTAKIKRRKFTNFKPKDIDIAIQP